MAANVFLISSSPVTESRRVSAFFGRSSSPDFPTVQELVAQQSNEPKRPTRSDDRAAPAPNGSPPAVADTATLLPQEKVVPASNGQLDVGDASVSLIEISPETFKKPGKPRSKLTAPLKGSGVQKKSAVPRKQAPASNKGITSKAQTLDSVSGAESSSAPKPAKPRRKRTETTSRHFPAEEPVQDTAPEKPTRPTEEEINAPLNLDAAFRRRESWTPPPKDTTVEMGSRSSDLIEILSSAVKEGNAATTQKMFKNLKETFGFEFEDEETGTADVQDGTTVLTKRKLIEMVSTTNMSAPAPVEPETSPVKQKAPKKKPRTITGLATEAYAPKLADDALQPSSLDKFVGATKGPADAAGSKAKAKPRKGKKASKKEDSLMVLLSPSAALKQVANQDFLFGTSSQLVLEEDAQLLRDMQTALRDSNRIEEGTFETPLNSDAIEPPEQRARLWNAAARDEEGELMDLEIIDLVDSPAVEVSKDDTDPFGYGLTTQGASQRPRDKTATGQSSSLSGGLLASSGSNTVSKLNPALVGGTSASQRPIHMTSSNSTDGAIGTTSPPPSSQKRLPRPGIDDVGSIPSALDKPAAVNNTKPTAQPQRPNYELMTDAQLARQVNTYGFKPIKKREGMITLLDHCWTSKHPDQVAGTTAGFSITSTSAPAAAPATGSNLSSNEMPPPPQAAAPKRGRGRPRKNSVSSVASAELPPVAEEPLAPVKKPRGRPRKNPAAAPAAAPAPAPAPASPKKKKKAVTTPKKKAVTTPKKKAVTTPKKKKKAAYLLEVSDSESDAASSPERLFSSSPPAFDISLATEDDTQLSLAMSPTTQQTELFVHITKAVTSAPPSNDPAHPSWHEKILLYDPIILEDLAAWLNTGELSRVGFDGEVSAQDVKKWCESKSVCCLWRERGGGQQRKRL